MYIRYVTLRYLALRDVRNCSVILFGVGVGVFVLVCSVVTVVVAGPLFLLVTFGPKSNLLF